MLNFLSFRSWVVFIGSEAILAGVLWMIGLMSPLLLIILGAALLACLWIWDHRPIWVPPRVRDFIGEPRMAEELRVQRFPLLKKERRNQIENSPPIDWRDAYILRDRLKIFEVACLLAGVPPQRPIPLGSASAFAEMLKEAVIDQEINRDCTNIGVPPNSVYKTSLSGMQESVRLYRDWMKQVTDYDTVIDRKELVRFFKKKRLPKAVVAIGGQLKGEGL